MLTRLIYVSQAAGDADVSAASLAEIIGAAIRNNQRRNISGVLLVHGGRFMQGIEGAAPDVAHLLRRLQQDARHDRMRVLFHGRADARRFGSAPMILGRVAAGVPGLLCDDAPAPEAALQALCAAVRPSAFAV